MSLNEHFLKSEKNTNPEVYEIPIDSWGTKLPGSMWINDQVNYLYNTTPLVVNDENPILCSQILRNHYECAEEKLYSDELGLIRFPNSSPLPIYAEIDFERELTASCISLINKNRFLTNKAPFFDTKISIIQINSIYSQEPSSFALNLHFGEEEFKRRTENFMIFKDWRMRAVLNKEIRRNIENGINDTKVGFGEYFLINNVLNLYKELGISTGKKYKINNLSNN